MYWSFRGTWRTFRICEVLFSELRICCFSKSFSTAERKLLFCSRFTSGVSQFATHLFAVLSCSNIFPIFFAFVLLELLFSLQNFISKPPCFAITLLCRYHEFNLRPRRSRRSVPLGWTKYPNQPCLHLGNSEGITAPFNTSCLISSGSSPPVRTAASTTLLYWPLLTLQHLLPFIPFTLHLIKVDVGHVHLLNDRHVLLWETGLQSISKPISFIINNTMRR